MPSFAEEFDQIIKNTDRILWASYLASAGTGQPPSGVQIRFPRKRKGEIRVSEQEASFVLTGQLAGSHLLYSVETPTSLTYQFTGDSGLSGQTDVTVYTPTGQGMWNLEFKAHGFSEDRANKLSTQKDIEKLLREPFPAYWFHTFEGVDNSTLATVWRAFLGDIREVVQRLSLEHLAAKPLVFHACVVRQRFSVEQKLWIDPSSWKSGVTLDVPSPIYVVTRSGLTSFEAKDGWECRRPEMN
jgi:hypothetical protein